MHADMVNDHEGIQVFNYITVTDGNRRTTVKNVKIDYDNSVDKSRANEILAKINDLTDSNYDSFLAKLVIFVNGQKLTDISIYYNRTLDEFQIK